MASHHDLGRGSAGGYDLTPRARDLLGFLSAQAGCPSFEEMRRALGIASKSGVDRLLRQLEARGYVRRRKRRERAIVVLRAPEGDGIVRLPLLGPVPAPWASPLRDHRTVAEVWADDESQADEAGRSA